MGTKWILIHSNERKKRKNVNKINKTLESLQRKKREDLSCQNQKLNRSYHYRPYSHRKDNEQVLETSHRNDNLDEIYQFFKKQKLHNTI